MSRYTALRQAVADMYNHTYRQGKGQTAYSQFDAPVKRLKLRGPRSVPIFLRKRLHRARWSCRSFSCRCRHRRRVYRELHSHNDVLDRPLTLLWVRALVVPNSRLYRLRSGFVCVQETCPRSYCVCIPLYLILVSRALNLVVSR